MEVDTIVAVATPPGEGGVGIVRVSGPLSADLPRRLFPALSLPWESHRLRHGRLLDPSNGSLVDEVLACFMGEPHSYTGEDVLEIQGHGNPLVLERIVDLCLREGCRAARPGEFTLRAFLNGRLDLSQAEAVLDVVRARTNAGLEMALEQLGGWLSAQVEPFRQRLLGTLAHIEAMVDFVEEDIPPQIDAQSRATLKDVREALGLLLAGAEQGIVLREGAALAIVGSPNVGKSSIMNALLGLDRSIVTPIPGTTRDTVEETLQVRGVPFRTVDTAGITPTEDEVERLGVERSRKALGSADVVLLVLDRSREPSTQDELTIEAVAKSQHEDKRGRSSRVVIALNKADLPSRLDPSSVVSRLRPQAIVESSAITIGGVDELREALADAALGGTRHEHVVGNVRHQEALRSALTALDAALAGLASATPLDLVSFDVRAAVQVLGEISGANVDEELLDRIFRDFCIGK